MTRVWLQLPDVIGASTWNLANRSAGQFEEVMNNDEHKWPKSVHWQLRTVSTGDLWSQRFQRPVKPRLVVMLFIFGLIFKSQVDADKTDGTNKQHVFLRSDWTVTRCCVSSPCHESVYGWLSRFVTIFIWRMTILLWTWTKSYWRRSKIKRWPTGTSPLYSTQCGCLAYCLAYCFDRFFDRFMRFHDDLVELQRLEKNSAIQQLAGHFSCMPPYWMGPPLLDAKAVRSFDMQLY